MADEATASEENSEATQTTNEESNSQETPPQEPDWKQYARKHEREAKKARAQLEELQGQLASREEAEKSETEKALDQARKEARAEAEAEFEQARRSDRLQVAVAKRARDLADVDDVVLNLKQGDTDDLFDEDGSVRDDAITSALSGLLERKPHLKAEGNGKPQGDADAGRGAPAAKSPEEGHNDFLLGVLGHSR
jgi:hypothetical protein